MKRSRTTIEGEEHGQVEDDIAQAAMQVDPGSTPAADPTAAAAATAPEEDAPSAKRTRLHHRHHHHAITEQQQQEEEWNLLGGLPYVPFHRLLSFLFTTTSPCSSSGGDDDQPDELPEMVRVRAQHKHFEPKEYNEDEEEEEAEKKPTELPFYVGKTARSAESRWANVAAMRLTSRAIKRAVDDIIVRQGHIVEPEAFGSARISEFLDAHFSVSPPLVRASAADAQICEDFRIKSELLRGAIEARIHTARLDDVLPYVCREWHISTRKLDDFHKLLFPDSSKAGVSEPTASPLIKVTHMRRDEDFLSEGYGLGITSCLSLGLPDLPQERVEVWMNLVQAWSQRDGGWEMHVHIELVCASRVWRERLQFLEQSSSQEEEKSSKSVMASHGRGKGRPVAPVASKDEATEDSDGESGGATTVQPLVEYYRGRGEVDDPPYIRFSLLRQLWDCLGMETTNSYTGDASSDKAAWTGKDILVALLGCMGYAWKPDVELMWDGTDQDPPPEEEEDYTGEVWNNILVKSTKLKRKEMASQQAFLDEFRSFVDRYECLSNSRTTSNVAAWELLFRSVTRYVYQKRLDRLMHVTWVEDWKCPEVAQRCQILRCRSFGLSPGEYASFSDESLEMACPVSAADLSAFMNATSPQSNAGAEATDVIESASARALRLVFRISNKSAYSYSGTSEQLFITVRVANTAGHSELPRLLNQLDQKSEDDDLRKRYGVRDDELMLCINRELSEIDMSDSVAFIRLMAAVGRLIGLEPSKCKAKLVDTEAKEPWKDYTQEEFILACDLLRFLSAATTIATWGADEGAYPVSGKQVSEWENDLDYGPEGKGELNWQQAAKEEASDIAESLITFNVCDSHGRNLICS